jgi:hypothetical protein
MPLDKIPIDVHPKAWQVVQVPQAIAHDRAVGIQTIVHGMALGIAVRFGAKVLAPKAETIWA